MEVVPWTYNNPRVDRTKLDKQEFIFAGKMVEIVQDTSKEIDASKNTAFKLWDGAYLLARHLEDKALYPDGFWHHKKCIELGSGCGLVGIVAGLLGANVTLTDLPEAMDHLDKCVNKNCDTKDLISVQPYSWGEDPKEEYRDIDYILGSDLVYHPKLNKLLVKSIDKLCQPNTKMILTYKPRGLQEDNFFKLLTNYGFCCEEFAKDFHPKDFQGSEYHIYKIYRKK